MTSLTSFAQVWHKHYPTARIGNAIQQTTDNGYIIVGSSGNSGSSSDAYLLKLDQYGDTMWTRAYGGSHDQQGLNVDKTTDGGYIVTGIALGDNNGNVLYLVRTTATGDTLWTKRYGNYSEGTAVKQTADGGFIVTGYTVDNNVGKLYLIKTDSAGDTTWTKMYGSPLKSAWGYSVQQTTDGGYIVTGKNQPYNGAFFDASYLVRTNATGDTLWTKNYGTNNNSYSGRAVTQTSDGGFAISGYANISNSFKAFLYKTDANGDVLWSKIYPGNGKSWAYGMAQTSDGGYIIVGTTNNINGGTLLFTIKTDAFGDTLWTKMYGGGGIEKEGYGVSQTSDGGFVVTGRTTDATGLNWSACAIKIGPMGTLISGYQLPLAPKQKKLVQRFDLLGRVISNPQPQQVYIELYDDGSTAKVIWQ